MHKKNKITVIIKLLLIYIAIIPIYSLYWLIATFGHYLTVGSVIVAIGIIAYENITKKADSHMYLYDAIGAICLMNGMFVSRFAIPIFVKCLQKLYKQRAISMYELTGKLPKGYYFSDDKREEDAEYEYSNKEEAEEKESSGNNENIKDDPVNIQMDFFAGVKTKESLKKRYRDLMKIYHPDNQNGDGDTASIITEQYEKLEKEIE